jgi:hypothetical protein
MKQFGVTSADHDTTLLIAETQFLDGAVSWTLERTNPCWSLLQSLFMTARVLTAASTIAVRVGFLQNSHVMGRLGRTRAILRLGRNSALSPSPRLQPKSLTGL